MIIEFEQICEAHEMSYKHFASYWQNPNPIELELFYEYLLLESFEKLKLDTRELCSNWEKLIERTPVSRYKQQINELRNLRFEFYKCYSSIYKIDVLNARLFFEKNDSLIYHLPMGESAYKNKEDHEKVIALWLDLAMISYSIHEVIEGRETLGHRIQNESIHLAVRFLDKCINLHNEHNVILKPAFGLKKAFRWFANSTENY